MSEIFDVKLHHFDIPEVMRHMDLEPLAAETISRQKDMNALWELEANNFYERLFWDRDKFVAWKVAKLQELVDWAYATCPFYKEYYGQAGYAPGEIRSLEDFASLPTISKDQVIANFPKGMPSESFDLKDCRWMSSSGSSGKQVQIVLPQKRADLDILFKYRMFEFMAGERLDCKKWIYNIHYCLWWHTSILGDFPVFSVTQDCDPVEMLKHIKLMKPQVISSIGSYLGQLANLGESLKEFGVKIISTNSETTTAAERARWSQVFGVPVRDEYSSEELDILAMECPYGNYHLNEDDAHLELINPDETGLGEVVGTDLWNFAMPMIRYRQGDLAALETETTQCPCGSRFQIMKGLHGRADQALSSRTKGQIAPGSLLDIVEATFCAEGTNISEFRVVQRDFDLIELLHVKKNQQVEIPKSVLSGFKARIEEVFGHQVEIQPILLTQIPEEKSYKRRTIINKMGTL